MRIPMDNVPNYTAEQIELAQDSEVQQAMVNFLRSNLKTFSVGDMAHVLGIRPEVLFDLLPLLRGNKDVVQHRTQMIVVLKPRDSAESDQVRFQECTI